VNEWRGPEVETEEEEEEEEKEEEEDEDEVEDEDEDEKGLRTAYNSENTALNTAPYPQQAR
jgi:hypothetical protein